MQTCQCRLNAADMLQSVECRLAFILQGIQMFQETLHDEEQSFPSLCSARNVLHAMCNINSWPSPSQGLDPFQIIREILHKEKQTAASPVSTTAPASTNAPPASTSAPTPTNAPPATPTNAPVNYLVSPGAAHKHTCRRRRAASRRPAHASIVCLMPSPSDASFC